MNAPLSNSVYRPRFDTWLFAREETAAGYERSDPAADPDTAADWSDVHASLVRLARTRATHERDLCRWLLAAERLGAHARAGYASLREYADRLLGLTPRQTEERLRVGRALRALPQVDGAFAAGELSWSAVRELTRIATPATEHDWLAWSRGRRIGQIESAVATRRPGDGPTQRADPTFRKHVLRFEVSPETLALFRDLQAAVRADLGAPADDDILLHEITRRALGGPVDEGRSSYQVAVTRCPDCELMRIDAAGESHAVRDEAAEAIACDAQHLPPPSPQMGVGAPRARATQTIPPAIRREVLRRHGKRCAVPGCKNHRYLDVHHCDFRSEGGTHDPERLVALCGSHHLHLHRGALSIDGTHTSGFTFRHADGTPYGRAISPRAIDTARQVVALLQSLGYKHAEARARVDAVQRTGAPPTVAAVLRAALHAR
jgi:hypothetical protein